MPERPCIAVDAMGGDGGPAVTVPAAMELCERADIVLVGDSQAIRAALPRPCPHLTIEHAAHHLTGADTLADVLRRRPDSSMRRALVCHAEGRADGVVSGGDTAALMALSRALLDMVDGVERPAICKAFRGMRGIFWMLDLGANLDCTPSQLHQFALMGSLLARHAGAIDKPRVGLLNIGTEPGKGPDAVNAAAALLAADPRLDYAGFVEGNVLFSGAVDVIVADGFAGNIALKSVEGAARMAEHLLRGWVDGLDPLEQAALAVVRGKLEGLRHEFNPQRYNGASFVGLSGVVVKSHGSADREGFRSAIEEAVVEVQERIPLRLAGVVSPVTQPR